MNGSAEISQKEHWQHVSELLLAALELTDAKQREALVRERAAGNDALYREVMSLLAAEANAATLVDDFSLGAHMGSDAPNAADHAPDTRDWIGVNLGAYKVTERIAAGGMGAVYKALRADDAYQTVVAIKLMREDLGAATAARVLSRFRAERQMLASLNHPNITRLLDAGSTPDGLPYFVMEYVDGQPIDRYCEVHGLGVTERLQKFRDVCSAVHFAHQRLIVHRDLKPSNILVDQSGVVKLLDFGIARLLDPVAEVANVADPSSAAATTMLALTPAYASPEQVKNEAITTASDVYSLGVVLYKMLTGRSPYKATPKRSLELAREIVETDPERPSTAITRPDATEPNASTPTQPDKRLDVARLRKALLGDLDNIVLMALRKEPGKRYASVEQFSQDVQRHLDGQPVIAHADSLAYRANKFVQRNRWSVSFAALAALGLIVGIVATTHQATLARQAQARAEAEKVRAETHFASVRSLASDVLFKVANELRSISGTTAVRKTLLASTAEYLTKLGEDAQKGNDPSLLAEISRGWLGLANLQGQLADSGSTAEPTLGLTSYETAISFADRARILDSTPSTLATLVRALRLHAVALSNIGRTEESRKQFDRAVAVGLADLQRSKNSRALEKELATALASHVFYVRGNGTADIARYRDYAARSISMAEQLVESAPNEVEKYDSETFLHYALGTLAKHANVNTDGSFDNKRALEWANRALEIAQRHAAGRANDARTLSALAVSHADIAAIAADMNDHATAIEHRTSEAKIYEQRIALDPEDLGTKAGLFTALAAIVESQFALKRFDALRETVARTMAVHNGLNSDAQQLYDVVAGTLAIHAIQARTDALFAVAAKSRAERTSLCESSVNAYRLAAKGRPRWEAFNGSSMAAIFKEIRDELEPCRRLVKDFPSE